MKYCGGHCGLLWSFWKMDNAENHHARKMTTMTTRTLFIVCVCAETWRRLGCGMWVVVVSEGRKWRQTLFTRTHTHTDIHAHTHTCTHTHTHTGFIYRINTALIDHRTCAAGRNGGKMPNLYSLLSSHPTHTRNSRHAGVCDRTIVIERGIGGGRVKDSKILDFYGAHKLLLLQKAPSYYRSFLQKSPIKEKIFCKRDR